MTAIDARGNLHRPQGVSGAGQFTTKHHTAPAGALVPEPDTANSVDEKGLEAARRLAGWKIGDPYWADKIIRAYLHPDKAHADLDADDVPKKTGVHLW